VGCTRGLHSIYDQHKKTRAISGRSRLSPQSRMFERIPTVQDLHGCRCKDASWSAILDMMPPEEPRLRVTGICTCLTGGFKASLKKAEPQGINPSILLLRLSVEAPSGIVNQLVTDYPVEYHEKSSSNYTHVTIFPCDITVPVEVVT
jgi:hypothetical protein